MSVLTVGELCRVAKPDNTRGCGAKGHLSYDAATDLWTLTPTHPTNEPVVFHESAIGHCGGFRDDDHSPVYTRYQLWR